MSEHDRSLDEVSQLTDVARPKMGAHFLRDCAGEVQPAVRSMELLEKGGDEKVKILGPLGKGGELDTYDREPEVQILTESAECDLAFEPSVGGGYDAPVDVARPPLADATNLPGL